MFFFDLVLWLIDLVYYYLVVVIDNVLVVVVVVILIICNVVEFEKIVFYVIIDKKMYVVMYVWFVFNFLVFVIVEVKGVY